jgi:hypothetical protein
MRPLLRLPQRLCGKDYIEARKAVGSILLCRNVKEMQDELRLPPSVTTA